MSLEIGSEITLDIEKPAAGGWMLARHEGRVVLVHGTIPGERVRARVGRVGRGVAYAEVAEVLVPSPDRRESAGDWRCGGNVFAHIGYERQRQLKGEIIRDAFGRIGRVALPAPPEVLASPERGYRMRARLHARHGRLGFFREGTHEVCDAASTGQLLPATAEWIAAAEGLMARGRLKGLLGIEIAENIAGDQRACHLELQAGAEAAAFAVLAAGGALTGLSAERADRPGVETLAGMPVVSDVLHVTPGDPATALRLRRDVRAFFQSNRYLLEPLVRHVVSLVPPGPVVDLYAGVGLFGLSLAAIGFDRIALVEGDRVSGQSLRENTEPFGTRVRVELRSVEAFLKSEGGKGTGGTFIVDPPRTGLSKEALGGIVRCRPARIVYVSCDVATLARDSRTLLDAGYELEGLTGIDLFPSTAHVETVAAYSRST
ncbi:MAG: class I SAM-dependent RNA methyltransferase [Acidobacteria bacterium]|nr:class I SAM-dependent RNA methyltransferase [Acidobacteriota bacterium]